MGNCQKKLGSKGDDLASSYRYGQMWKNKRLSW